MEAKELRIGNWVKFTTEDKSFVSQIYQFNDGLTKVTSGTYSVSIGYPYKSVLVEPIPLTEEILLKCGFEKLKGKNNENTFMNADLNFGNPVLKLNDYTMLCTNGGYEYLF